MKQSSKVYNTDNGFTRRKTMELIRAPPQNTREKRRME